MIYINARYNGDNVIWINGTPKNVLYLERLFKTHRNKSILVIRDKGLNITKGRVGSALRSNLRLRIPFLFTFLIGNKEDSRSIVIDLTDSDPYSYELNLENDTYIMKSRQ